MAFHGVPWLFHLGLHLFCTRLSPRRLRFAGAFEVHHGVVVPGGLGVLAGLRHGCATMAWALKGCQGGGGGGPGRDPGGSGLSRRWGPRARRAGEPSLRAISEEDVMF